MQQNTPETPTSPASEGAQTPCAPPLPADVAHPILWGQLYGSGRGLALAQAARSHAGPILVVTEGPRSAEQLAHEIRFFGGEEVTLLPFPDWEILPYDAFSPHQDIISRRLLTLYQLPALEKGIVITPVQTLMHRLPPRQFVQSHSFVLNRGDHLDLGEYRQRLSESGYLSVSQVMAPGEFAIRGGLIDLYPMGSREPYRIDLFGDEVESIRGFDPDSQRSGEAIDTIRLLPAREFPMNPEAIQRFRQAFRAHFEGDPQLVPTYRDVSQGLMPAGIEAYLPLFLEQTETIFDYLPESTLLVMLHQSRQGARDFQLEIAERYGERVYDRERPPLPPELLYMEAERFLADTTKYRRVEMLGFRDDEVTAEQEPAVNTVVRFDCPPPPQMPVDHRADAPYHLLFDFLRQDPHRVLLVADAPGRRETFRELLRDNGFEFEVVSSWAEFLKSSQKIVLTDAPMEKGLVLNQPRVTLICETQLYGERAAQRRRRSQLAREPDVIIRSLAELKEGDPVVHEDHGVGRYLGLQNLDVGDGVTEFVTLEYADGDKLYIPVVSLHLISRYTGTDPEHTPLHKLGGEAWEKAKRRAQKKAFDTAVELLEIYAKRQARKGHAFSLDQHAYDNFSDRFPFEETPDQQRAIDEVLRDMQNTQPMDRLICGDVGFGKTEVALRAAFVAAAAGKQVAVLVPTTLLAQQHFQNFSDRFADEAIKVEVLSRFKTKKEIEQILDSLGKAKVDIIIGTHRLLQSDIKFKNLGLVIVDEEHRFGVRHKEQLKKLRSEVDFLTLTATPIPRTLNMALSGMRDISIIATAPQARLSVKTFVYEDNKAVVREACLREIRRGGQVYYLHNEVRTMERAVRELEELLPEAEIRMAHGQMPERELERIMLDFYHQRFNVLVCSTIIESGIDIPSANTIVIERADRFGLAQLHQLRGRVGRSHHRAYAYMMVPSRKSITGDARKRLDAIASLEELGAGFALASHDLEIRGAGELLGDQQSGAIDEIGFTMYSELLNRAVESLKRGESVDIDTSTHSGAEINIHSPVLLPDSYLPDIHMRLVLYKRIANARTKNDLQLLREEIIDRFGRLPDATDHLFRVTALKIDASKLGVHKIDAGPRGMRIEFNHQAQVDPANVISLLQSEPGKYSMDGPSKLRVKDDMQEPDDRITRLSAVLSHLTSGRG